MTVKQWLRLNAVARVSSGELSAAKGALLARMSPRNFRRLRRRVEKQRTKAVVHGNTGRLPWNRITDDDRARILELAKTTYAGFNDHHLTEKLVEVERIDVSRASVQRILRGAGVATPRRRRPRKHRRRRERRAQEGMMLLWDGSNHDWLEGRGPRATLVGAIDDATGRLMPGAHFVVEECAAAYLGVLREVVRHRGIPVSIYMDRHGSLRRNDWGSTVAEELTGKRTTTQVSRALEELGIEAIYALSPQAKGRIERLWGTLQSRLISELRLSKIETIEAANTLMDTFFIADFNKRFALSARETGKAWRPTPPELNLDRICALRYQTVVGNDNAVRVGKVVVDIPPGPRGRSYAKACVEAVQRLDGSWRIFFQDAVIAKQTASTTTELRVASNYVRAVPGRRSRVGERFWEEPVL